MNHGTPQAQRHLDEEALEDHLRRLQAQSAQLTHRHLALTSWSFEQKALSQEQEWRRRHPLTDR